MRRLVLFLLAGAPIFWFCTIAIGKEVILPVGPSCSDMFNYNGVVYFCADHPHLGKEVHVVNGSRLGTRVLNDIDPGPGSSTPRGFFEFRGDLYFFAENTQDGESLWRTDGSEEGLKKIISISQVFGYRPTRYVASVGDDFYFEAKKLESDVHTEDPYLVLLRSNGTHSGTAIVDVPVSVGLQSSLANIAPTTYSLYNDSLYLVTLRSLYRVSSGGAVEEVFDDLPLNNSLIQTRLTDYRLLNSMVIRANGQLWLSDGTGAGTRSLINLPESDVTEFSVIGDRLIYATSRHKHNTDLGIENPSGLELRATNGLSDIALRSFPKVDLDGPFDHESIGFWGDSSQHAWFAYTHNDYRIQFSTRGSVNLTRDHFPAGFSPDIEYAGKVYGVSGSRLRRVDPISGATESLGLFSDPLLLKAVQQGVVFLHCVTRCQPNQQARVYGLAIVDASGSVRLLGEFYKQFIYEIPLRHVEGQRSYFEIEDVGIWHTDGTKAGTYLLMYTYDDGEPLLPQSVLILPSIYDLLFDEE